MKIPPTKNSRHQAIKEIVSNKSISSQAQILKELRRLGIEITQATLSRDLDELKIAKSQDAKQNTYQINQGAANQLKRIINADLIVGIDHSANIAVVRTPPGGAQFFASSVDSSGLNEIIGTIAGDDTVLIVTKDAHGGKKVAEQLWELARSNR
ncbi:MAG: arginine repressor [Candidatus Nanopelagicales bacterium]